ncbi:MAG: CPBP family glutamic-type intramembrane protease [Legionellales bacterium]|nr:CPBP family glutamic-type intramembrane protease [Legionellales bacterium]
MQENRQLVNRMHRFSIFRQFTLNQVSYFVSKGAVITRKKNDRLKQAHEASKECYLILEGEVEIIHKNIKDNHRVGITATPGQLVSKYMLINDKIPAESARCLTDCRLFVITSAMMDELIKHDFHYCQFIKNIGFDLCKAYEITNEKVNQLMKQYLASYRARVALGKLFIVSIVVLSLLSVVDVVEAPYARASGHQNFTLCLMLVLGATLFISFKIIQLPSTTYGLTWRRGKEAFLAGLLYSLPMCILAVLMKWTLIHSNAKYAGMSLFDNLLLIPHTVSMLTPPWFGHFYLYILLVCPFQELLIRCGMQAPIQQLLVGRYRALWAILVSNMVFTTAHLYVSTMAFEIVFVPGLLFGWLFYRYNNLIAPITAHIIIGAWGLFFVGFRNF